MYVLFQSEVILTDRTHALEALQHFSCLTHNNYYLVFGIMEHPTFFCVQNCEMQSSSGNHQLMMEIFFKKFQFLLRIFVTF